MKRIKRSFLLATALLILSSCSSEGVFYTLYCPFVLSHSPETVNEWDAVKLSIDSRPEEKTSLLDMTSIHWETNTDNFRIFNSGQYISGRFPRGEYFFVVTIINENGKTYTLHDSITVLPLENYFPSAIFSLSNIRPQEGESVTFDATSSYDSDGTIISYQWDFGDGTTGSGPQTTHAYLKNGTYLVLLTITDDYGDIDTAKLSIYIKRND